jgi:hypothetical protein
MVHKIENPLTTPPKCWKYGIQKRRSVQCRTEMPRTFDATQAAEFLDDEAGYDLIIVALRSGSNEASKYSDRLSRKNPNLRFFYWWIMTHSSRPAH